MNLTSRERLERIFRKQEIDRPALKVWGSALYGTYPLLSPLYEPVAKLAAEKTDLFLGCGGFACDLIAGQNGREYREVWEEDNLLFLHQHQQHL